MTKRVHLQIRDNGEIWAINRYADVIELDQEKETAILDGFDYGGVVEIRIEPLLESLQESIS